MHAPALDGLVPHIYADDAQAMEVALFLISRQESFEVRWSDGECVLWIDERGRRSLERLACAHSDRVN